MMILSRWASLKEQLQFRYAPRAAKWLVRLSTYEARKKIGPSGPCGILVDNTVLYHAITHETAWVSTGKATWGNQEIDTGYAARIPVHAADSQTREYRHVRYLSGIAQLARDGFLKLHTSAEIQDERFRQPAGRYQGYGYFDFDIFGDIEMRSIDGAVCPTIGPDYLNLPSAAEQQSQRLLRARTDPHYAALVAQLGEKNSQDAWHIHTAEIHGLFCFLTMDFKLLRTIEAASRRDPVKSLRTLVLTPDDFGRRFGLKPIPPGILSYTDASFFVRADLSAVDGKRRPSKSYRKRI